jgi:hypothetical protein
MVDKFSKLHSSTGPIHDPPPIFVWKPPTVILISSTLLFVGLAPYPVKPKLTAVESLPGLHFLIHCPEVGKPVEIAL